MTPDELTAHAFELLDLRLNSAPRTWWPVLIAESGSTIYGTSLPGQDDLDLTFVGFESWDELVLGSKSHHLRTATGDAPSGPDDIDMQCHTVRKYIDLVAGGNPSVIATLWAPHWVDDEWAKVNRFTGSNRIDDLRALAWTRRAGQAYAGYAVQQLKRMRGEIGQRGVIRRELIDRYGFDTKYAYHALRLTMQGIEFARTGNLTIPLPAEEVDLLLSVRRGEIAETRVETMIADGIKELEDLIPTMPAGRRDADSRYRKVTADLYEEYWYNVLRYRKITADLFEGYWHNVLG